MSALALSDMLSSGDGDISAVFFVRRGLATGADAVATAFVRGVFFGAAFAGAAAGSAADALAVCFISAPCLRSRSMVRSSLMMCAPSSALLNFGAAGAALRTIADFVAAGDLALLVLPTPFFEPTGRPRRFGAAAVGLLFAEERVAVVVRAIEDSGLSEVERSIRRVVGHQW